MELKLNTCENHDLYLTDTGKIEKEFAVLTPQGLTGYNNTKKSVDYTDQIGSYSSLIQQDLKWYRNCYRINF